MVIRPGAAFHVADGAEREMRRQFVFLAARRLAGVAGNAVVGVEIEAVLFVAVRVLADRRVAVDGKRPTAQHIPSGTVSIDWP